MAKSLEKNTGTTKPVTIESGWGTFLLLLAKTIAITVATVFIPEYIFKIPLSV